MPATPSNQRDQIVKASLRKPFSFEQGSSLHVGLLGLVGRPTTPGDQDPYGAGLSADGKSVYYLDLGRIHDQTNEEPPPVALWFDEQRTIVDLSAAFDGVSPDALAGSGIPSEVLAGPVSVDKTGDAGDGVLALLTQVCQGRFVVDPRALLGLIASDKITGFAQSASEEYLPLRAFNAQMPAADLLEAIGLSSEALINQIASLGFDLRGELGAPAVAALDRYLRTVVADLSWFIDDQERIQTAQAVWMLTDFFAQLFRSDVVVEQFAREEDCSVAEMRDFVDEMAEKGRLVYANATWQTIRYDDETQVGDWPEAPDITEEVAAQVARLRGQPSDSEALP